MGLELQIETALGLIAQPGTEVTLCHRSEDFPRIKERNREKLRDARERGRLRVLVSADGTFSAGGYSWAPPLNGGFTVLELSSREEAIAWAARIAKACRCDQELRVFQYDPES